MGKLTSFMRTTPNLKELLKLLEDIICFTFIPTITGDQTCSDHDQILFCLPARFGRLGIPTVHKIGCFEYKISRKLLSFFSKLIKQQSLVYTNNDFQEKKLKNEIKQKETEDTKILLTQLQNQMNDNVKRLNTIPQEKGGSNCLT